MRASGFPESLCVVVPLHHVCVCDCVCTTVCVCRCLFVSISCVYLFERETMKMHVTVKECVWLIVRVYIFGASPLIALLYYHQRFPAVAVSHKHTHTQYIHTHPSSIDRTSLFCILVLYRVTSSQSGLLCPKGRDRQTDYHRVLNENHCHILI